MVGISLLVLCCMRGDLRAYRDFGVQLLVRGSPGALAAPVPSSRTSAPQLAVLSEYYLCALSRAPATQHVGRFIVNNAPPFSRDRAALLAILACIIALVSVGVFAWASP
jgi:hypothetical protein